MHRCLMVPACTCCDAQEWIGSLARRGICLLHLVDEEVSALALPECHMQGDSMNMNSASAETWNEINEAAVFWVIPGAKLT